MDTLVLPFLVVLQRAPCHAGLDHRLMPVTAACSLPAVKVGEASWGHWLLSDNESPRTP